MRLLPFVAVLLLAILPNRVAAVDAPPPDWLAGKAPPNFETFWRKAPERDPMTELFWQFDGESGPGLETAMTELDPAALLANNDDNLVSEARVKMLTAGPVRQPVTGRFGKGVHLDAGGTLSTDHADFASWLDQGSGATVELWVSPTPPQAGNKRTACTLWSIGSVRRDEPAAVRCTLAGTGEVEVWSGDTRLAVSHEPVPPGVWTHVAVVLRSSGVAQVRVMVNGNERVSAGGDAARDVKRALDQMSQVLTFGDASPEGFAGDLDEIRVSRSRRYYYPLSDPAMLDVEAKRPFLQAPPYFLRRDLWLELPFDGSGVPTTFNGVAVEGAAALPATAFVPGVRGRALDLSQVPADNSYALTGWDVVPHGSATLEFWMQPTGWSNYYLGADWMGQDLSRFPLLRTTWKGAPPYLSERAVSVGTGVQARFAGARHWARLGPGTWTHILVAWGDGQPTMTWIDGQSVECDEVRWEGGYHPMIREQIDAWKKRIGDGADDGTFRLILPRSATLLDELRIYPYRFTPEEAQNAYARWFPDRDSHLTALPAIRAGFEYFAHSWTMQQKLDIRLHCLPVNEVTPATASLTLRPVGDGAAVLATLPEIKLDASGQATVTLAQAFDFGDYEAEIHTFAADGKELATKTVPYHRTRPEWYENTLGETPTVPKPWTPVTVTTPVGAAATAEAPGPVLGVWERQIALASTGLPARLTTLGREVLAAPATLTATVGGMTRTFTGASDGLQLTPPTSPAPDRIDWSATSTTAATAAATGDDATTSLTATVQAHIEFDGLMAYRIAVQPTTEKSSVQLDALWLDIPLTATEATQLICNTGGGNFRAAYDVRFIPAGDGVVWDTLTRLRKGLERAASIGNFCPSIWVGGDYVGLHFYGDNDRGWTFDNEHAAQELRRMAANPATATPAAVVLRLNLIAQPVTLAGPRTFGFYLTPTPTKPLEPDARAWNRAPQGTPWAKVDEIDTYLGLSLTDEPGHGASDISFLLEPKSWESAAVQAAKLRQDFGPENPVLMYINYSWPKLGPSMADWNHDLWSASGRIAWTPEVEDYYVWIMNEYIRRDLVDGLYIDDMSMGRTLSLASTAYEWTDAEGHVQRRNGFNSMGFRRFLMRCYRLLEARGKRPLLFPHMTYCFEVPALSFCLAAVNGEDRDIFPYDKRDAIGTWSLDEVRIMGGADKWGWATFWKPTIQKTEEGTDKGMTTYWLYHQSRAMHALLLPADHYYLWTYPSALSISGSLNAFDLRDPALRFTPYWGFAGIANATGVPSPPKAGTAPEPASQDAAPLEFGKNLLLAAWIKPQGPALLMLSNLTTQDCDVTLTLDPGALWQHPVGSVTWADADLTIEPPDNPMDLSGNVVDAALGGGKGSGASATDALTGGPALSDDALLEGLEKRDKKADARDALRPRPDGMKVTLKVRAHDYRLLKVTPK